jgi:hypothetical protein
MRVAGKATTPLRLMPEEDLHPIKDEIMLMGHTVSAPAIYPVIPFIISERSIPTKSICSEELYFRQPDMQWKKKNGARDDHVSGKLYWAVQLKTQSSFTPYIHQPY